MQPQGTQDFKTASQLQIESAELKKIINQLADQMKLRQWCIEQASRFPRAPIEKTVQYFYDFVTNAPKGD